LITVLPKLPTVTIKLNLRPSGHPWIVDDTVAPDKPLDSAVISRLKQFSAMNKVKKMALRVCFCRVAFQSL